ncbi:OmpA family protein [Rhodovulum sp. PH10]|uniref:OmpA family protein n=1 Tax=Rhodovulum sp. PH10 TaxID=1187851 RepID=UPI00192C68A4|nr:OmpA family protein [Rhodovulum sp. PH10]
MPMVTMQAGELQTITTRAGGTRAFGRAVAGLMLVAGLAFATPSLAQSPSSGARPTEQQLIEALRPPPKTRGLTFSPKAAEDQSFLQTIRGKTRALTLDERTKVADIAREKSKVDLEVYFDYDSSQIVDRAVPDLMELGKALSSAELRGGTFLLGGHTDGAGSDRYNQGLSERRAAAVKRFLLEKFDIPADSLVTAGYGEEQLKHPDQPLAADNRRVQIVNLEVKTSSAK